MIGKYGSQPEEIKFERVDSLPVVLSILMKMGIQAIVDKHHTPHGNHEGLSVGWLCVIFLSYILTRATHKMAPVQAWVSTHLQTLERLTRQTIRPTDFTDDRLADVLRYLSEDELWWQIDQDLSQRVIRVYDIEVNGPVRLDATTGGVTHDEKKHPLFQRGRNKAGGFEVQFKVMLGALDPMGMPLASDVVAGNTADDPLYAPIYRRIRQTLGQVGLLYIGDCKMGALETRAVISDGGDFYLAPLAMVGDVPALLDAQLDRFLAGQVELTPVYLPEDLSVDPDEVPDPELAIAEGFEMERQEQATLEDGTRITWSERLLIVRSVAFSQAQQQAFAARLANAQAELEALTPPPGRGKRQFDDPRALQEAIDTVLARYDVVNFFQVHFHRQVTPRTVRAYKGRPARTEEKVRYQVEVTRQEEAIEQARQRLGFRIYATNEKVERVNLAEAVLAYREQYLAERNFARLKGPILAMLPLFVQRDDHAKGLIRVLTVALRALTIIEFVVRRSLKEENEKLANLYDGNPKRTTEKPTAELILHAFEDITLSSHLNRKGELQEHYLTPLNDVQIRLLKLLGLSPDIYNRLTRIPIVIPLSRKQGRPASRLAS